jgi:hypothetical protein
MDHKLSRRDFSKLLLAGTASSALGMIAPSLPAFAASNRVVIIGGGFGGATAAKYLRKLDPSLSITLVEPKTVFHTCPVSNWVITGLKTMPDITQSYTALKNRYRVNVITDSAVAINPSAGTVKLKSGKTLHYDRLIVSPGIDFRWDAIQGNFDGPFDQVICDALRVRNNAQISLSPGFRWGTTVLPGEAITMEHVLEQTCMTYPETYKRDMSGMEIKNILEDVADNLFNPDPYYQQGGDMVRVGGMSYQIDPAAAMGQRIDEMRLENGELVDASKKYRVAGWATVGAQSTGEPIWDTVAAHLQEIKTVEIKKTQRTGYEKWNN